MTRTLRIPFEHSYAALPARLHARCGPTPVRAPRLVRLNAALADLLGLEVAALSGTAGAEMFAGNLVPEGGDPLAMAYAGHQFGHFVPQLGDGRALLLGELVGRDGQRRDVQLKGPGRTPYSRGGDGRCALGPALREYVLSEAMFALGVPTTRALAVATTGEPVQRDGVLPGAVFTRVAASHIRVGTFQFAAARDDREALRALADHAIARHDPAAVRAERPTLAFLDGVVSRQAALVVRWMLLGFIHGVMNTDNTTVSGETIDYGPCAFLDEFDPAKVFSSIDHGGRYAWGRQPAIAHWNLTRLAEALLPLIAAEAGGDEARAAQATRAVLAEFPARFASAWRAGLLAKLGISSERDGDEALAEGLLAAMATAGADFTQTFRRLCDAAESPADDEPVRNALGDDGWNAWRARLRTEEGSASAIAARMRTVNPARIPRNHRVEEVIAAAVERDDFGPFHALVDALARPFDTDPGLARYSEPPLPEQRVRATFCGT